MQTLDELNKIESDIVLLEKYLIDEEIELAVQLLQAVSENIEEVFTFQAVNANPDIQQAAINVYSKINHLITVISTKKQGVAKTLSGHMSNQKKINAYKST